MKTTIDIADDIFEKAQTLARKQGTTLRALTEEGLRLVLARRRSPSKDLPPLVIFGSGGLTDDFKDADWSKIRDEIYRGHGA